MAVFKKNTDDATFFYNTPCKVSPRCGNICYRL